MPCLQPHFPDASLVEFFCSSNKAGFILQQGIQVLVLIAFLAMGVRTASKYISHTAMNPTLCHLKCIKVINDIQLVKVSIHKIVSVAIMAVMRRCGDVVQVEWTGPA